MSAPGRRRARGVAGAWALACVVAACGTLPWQEEEGPPVPRERDFFAEGVEALEVGDFAGAEDRFRRLAWQCETRDEGRRALVLLAALELDPRNPSGSVAEAARLAAVHLTVPDAPAEERALSRTLYLAALDRGAMPVRDTTDLVDPEAMEEAAAVSGPLPAALLPPARRFSACDEPPPALAELPRHPGMTAAAALRGAEARGTAARHRTDSLQARVLALEAELERIRKLLRGGGGAGTPP